MLTDRFIQYTQENDLLNPGDRVLLAVSGGVDSMVMLSLFAGVASAGHGWPVGVAHCNFGLRGDEGDEDTELVKAQAARFGVECYTRNFDTIAETERTGESIQMAARRLRYDWFGELCRDHGYTAVAIAHQADDSVETFFINLFRGTGLRGLTGISPVRGRVVRPLLFATRRELAEYAHANDISYREDSSNRSTKYLRNKIRLGLIPRLREISPRFGETMRRNVDRLTQTQGFIDAAIGRIRDEVVRQEGSTAVIELFRIEAAFPAGFVIYELLSSGWGFKGDAIDGITASLERGDTGRRFYSRDHVAFTDRGRILIEPIAGDDPCEVTIDESRTRAHAGNAVYYFQRIDIDQIDTLTVPDTTALIDADRLLWPLTLRRWREGDRFVPLGMEGSKKVSDYLIDAKVSLPEKGRQFVLVNSGGEIVWIAGRRLDDRYKITPKTENVLKITKEVI
ncbi:MAG: tRNA lysidine(34) synthetase TilS [Alistipes sp.]|jgi:tRNA(Ile)-lysidine synthase|nr:tRNA lysidine(34) synthetase TilS [Alistipes sp.]